MVKSNKRNITIVIVVSLLTIFALTLQACQKAPDQTPMPDTVIEDPEVIIEPETEDETDWSPELILNLPHDEKVSSVAFSHDGSRIATGFFMQTNIWNPSDGSLVQSIEMDHTADNIAFTPDDQAIASGLSLYGVKLYSVSDGEILQEYHGGYDNFLSISPEGNWIATGNRNGITWLWQIDNGELLAEMDPTAYVDGYSEYLTSIAFSPDGQMIASGYWDGKIFLWQTPDGSLIDILEPETAYCSAHDLAFSIDGQYLAVGGAQVEFDQMPKIWDVSNRQIVHYLEGFGRFGSRNAPVAFSPDGNLFASGGVEGIYIWSLPEYELIHFLPIQESTDADWVTDLAFSPDSQFLLSGYWGGYAQLWQVQQPLE